MRVNKKILFPLLMIVFTFVTIFFNSGLAHAAPFGYGKWYGYFGNGSNHYDQYGDNLFANGIASTDIAAFIKVYSDALNGKSTRDQASAAFTILTMLGEPAGSPISHAYTRFPEWQATVQWYADNNLIDWTNNYYFDFNTYLQTNFDDVAWYANSNTLPSIVFFNPSGGTYAIKRDCANPVGEMTPLDVVKPTVVKCGAITSVTPSRPEVGDVITVTTTVTYTGGPPTPAYSGQSMSVAGVGNVGVASVTRSGGTYSIRSNGFTVPSVGKYTVSWTLSVNGVASVPNPCGGDINSSGDTFDIFSYPYVEVNGGDTAAGARFATNVSQPCAASNNNAGISTWNKNTPTYAGSGGQYAASAFSYIQEFLTNRGNGNGASYSSLSLGGINVNQPAGQYGGFFGKGPCVDYWSKKPSSGLSLPNPGNQSLNGLDGEYVLTGSNLTINPSNISANTHLTIYVKGNVAIKGSIKYGGSPNPTWASSGEIPSFKLIVQGAIYVDSSVDQLDGTYIAVPNAGYETTHNFLNSPLPGTIVTCANANNFTVRSPSNVANIAPCRGTLTVNGSFVANAVYLLRTIGSMSSGTPAEKFNYNPEVWLSPDSQGSVDPAYQSIVGLPPVL